MGFIKTPFEIRTKKVIAALVYGEPGSGKTTIGCSAPAPVLFDFDGGVGRINAAHRVPTLQVSTWSDVYCALKEVQDELPETQTIIIDTVGKMLDFMSAAIISGGERGMVNKDGTLSLKGYGVRKNMFIEFNHRILHSGKNVIYIAHEKEEKRGDEYVKRPEVGGSSVNDLLKELDLVGYMHMSGNKRTITFNPDERWYAKNTCNLPPEMNVPMILNENGDVIGANDFLCRIIGRYEAQKEKDAAVMDEYGMLVDMIKANVEEIKDADSANAFAVKMCNLQHIYNSKLLARDLLKQRASILGLNYDAQKKQYV